MRIGKYHLASLALIIFWGCKKSNNDSSAAGGEQVPTTALLSLTKAGSGAGRVVSTPAAIDCGSACQSTVSLGTVLTLTAIPSGSSTFAGWVGGGCSGTGSCVVTINAALNVIASFNDPAAVTRTLSVGKNGSGGGTVTSSPAGIQCGADCTENYSNGTVVALSAAPDGTSQFDGWSGGGCSGTGPCNVALGADTVVTATFSPLPPSTHALSVSRSGDGGGSVTSVPAGINCGSDCAETYASGASVTLTATPDADSNFTGWTGACSGTGACTVSMTVARTVGAVFAAKTFALTVTKSGGGGGTIAASPAGINCGSDCSQNYAIGTSVQLTATSDLNSIFSGWSGDCSGTGPCVVTMGTAHAVTATFDRLVVLTVSKIGNGIGTVASVPSGIDCGADCAENYAPGTSVILSAVPNGDLVSFNGWTGGCSGSGDCALTMNADVSVSAVFKNYVNDPTVIGVSPSYSVRRTYSYEPDMRLDTEQYTRDFQNSGPADARNVKITLIYSSGPGGTGTVYGSTSQSFNLVRSGEAKTFSVFTDLSPNPSSWYYTRIVEAWVPDTTMAAAASPKLLNGGSTTTRITNPFVGEEGKKSGSGIYRD